VETSRRAHASAVVASVLLACLSAAGCSKCSTREDPGGRGVVGPCELLVEEFLTTRRAGTLSCSEDKDCACFDGVDSEVPCGGVIDAKTAQKLAAIEKKMNGPLACTLSHQCAAQICNPGCVSGKCVATKPSYH
jgi:hypothetical protein